MRKAFSIYEYDVVVSFAEEERDMAVSISLALEKEGLQSYYYPHHLERNLGLNLEESLIDLYSNKARLAIGLFSEAYFNRAYTQVELRAILARMSSDQDYLIPVVFEDKPLGHPLTQLTYYLWQKDPVNLARLVKERYSKKASDSFIFNKTVISGLSNEACESYHSWLLKLETASSTPWQNDTQVFPGPA